MSAQVIPAPGFRLTTQRRWLLSVGMVLALLQGAMFAVIDPDLAGWHPHHGHVTLGGAVPDHTHPWDADHGAPRGLVTGTDAAGADDPVFSGSALGHLGSVAGFALPAAVLIGLAGLALVAAPPAGAPARPRSPVLDVPVPPPRS